MKNKGIHQKEIITSALVIILILVKRLLGISFEEFFTEFVIMYFLIIPVIENKISIK